jgi:hypothetical protein
MKRAKKEISLSRLLILITIIWIVSGASVWLFFNDWNSSSTFGDAFGAINSLFSGLALGGIIYTIYLQKTELSLQRKELKYTRLELERTANAQEISAKQMTEQIRINNLPYLQYSSFQKSGKNYLIISNESENLAFDIDIWIFITELDFIYPYKQFINEWVDPAQKSYIKIDKLVDDQLWGIAERGIYHVFPRNTKIRIPIDYPIGSNSFNLFIQFRDSLGNNYGQNIFFNKKQSSNFPFYDSVYEPTVPTISKRVDLSDEKLNESDLPEIAKGLIDLLNASIFVSRLKERDFTGVENVWEFENVKK